MFSCVQGSITLFNNFLSNNYEISHICMEFEGHECNQMHRKSISIQSFLISSRCIVLVFSDQNIHHSIVFCILSSFVKFLIRQLFMKRRMNIFSSEVLTIYKLTPTNCFWCGSIAFPQKRIQTKWQLSIPIFLYFEISWKSRFFEKNALFKSENENQNLNQFEKRA